MAGDNLLGEPILIIDSSNNESPLAPPLHWREIAVLFYIGIATSMVTALSPLIYAQMVAEGRLLTRQIGHIATVEACTLAISMAIYGAALSSNRLRFKIVVAGILFTITNIASAWMPYPYIIPLRMLAGCCEGIAVWLVIQLYAHTPVPARIQGLFVSVVGAVGFVLSATYSGIVLEDFGSVGGYLCLAVLSGMTVLLAPFGPRSLVELPRGGGGRLLMPTPAGFVGLASIVLIFAGMMGVWVYLPSLAKWQGQPGWVGGVAISAALAMQIVGGLTAAMATHLPTRATLVATWSVCVFLVAVWLTVPAPWIFVLCSAVLGFCWMFFTPFQSSLLVELDPSRRSLIFLSTADALGGGLGPAVVSFAILGNDVRGAFFLGALLFAAGLALVVWYRVRSLPLSTAN